MVRTMVAAGAVLVALGVGAAGAAGPIGTSSTGGAIGASGTRETGGASDVRPPTGTTARDRPAAVPSTTTTIPTDLRDATAHARGYAPPLDPPLVVARPFDGPAQPWAAGHRGVDLATHPGQVVRAPEAGVVTFAGTVVDRGVVTVTHPDGLRSSLEPVQWSVGRGGQVLRGQRIGTVAAGPGHCAPSTCLHWGLRRGENYLDPMDWLLARGPVVLLPLD